MGQRLVVTIKCEEKEMLKIYYHWSAYSVSALMETRDIINELFDDDNEIKDLRLRMIRFSERNGGGISNGKDSDEWKYIQNEYPNETFKEKNINRNYGLIAISKEGMRDLQDWSEGDITIDLDEYKVINYVYCGYDGIDNYNEYMKEWNNDHIDRTLEDIPELDCELSEFDFTDIDYLIEALDNAPDYVVRYGNEIYNLIA